MAAGAGHLRLLAPTSRGGDATARTTGQSPPSGRAHHHHRPPSSGRPCIFNVQYQIPEKAKLYWGRDRRCRCACCFGDSITQAACQPLEKPEGPTGARAAAAATVLSRIQS
ncbi:hypothetical protein BS78_08G029700 [Paspalum vaginatum]|nr:hypothetical protein BS78_08G029700 [Paspalum vaginatum]